MIQLRKHGKPKLTSGKVADIAQREGELRFIKALESGEFKELSSGAFLLKGAELSKAERATLKRFIPRALVSSMESGGWRKAATGAKVRSKKAKNKLAKGE